MGFCGKALWSSRLDGLCSDGLFGEHMQKHIEHRAGNALVAKFALGILAFTFAAFAMKAAAHPTILTRYTPLVIMHGLIMMAWMAMFASQSRLAAKARLPRHRSMGRWSPLLAIGMVVTGLTVSWNLSQEVGRYDVLVGNIGLFLTFLPLFVAAIVFARNNKQAEHRMAMLLATLSTLGPAYARVTDVLELPLVAGFPIQLVVTLTLPIWLDKASRGQVAKSTWLLLGFYFAVLFTTAAVFFAVLGPPR